MSPPPVVGNDASGRSPPVPLPPPGLDGVASSTTWSAGPYGADHEIAAAAATGP
ncbi:hypothetical protein [Kitasatospora sp. NPDC088548]|uniref:hypothetical protein n=1 Tax=Kitasatospora sp. NPDC088548 TaxID=3364075 RepID=UPI00380A7683